jgi:hypothetical protein
VPMDEVNFEGSSSSKLLSTQPLKSKQWKETISHKSNVTRIFW